MFKFLSALLFITVVFTACGEEKEVKVVEKQMKKVEVQEQKPSKAQVIDEVASKLKLSAVKAIDKASVVAKDISKSSEEAMTQIKEQGSKLTTETLTSVKEVSKDVSAKITSSVDAIMESKEKEATLNIDAKQLYMKCAGCHGQKAEKSALNKSQIIKNWDSASIENSLNGYKDDTYGGAMKGLMKSQVLSLSKDEIKLLSDYITTLK